MCVSLCKCVHYVCDINFALRTFFSPYCRVSECLGISVFMQLCIWVRLCSSLSLSTYVCILCISACVIVCMCECVCTHVYIYIYMWVHVWVYICICYSGSIGVTFTEDSDPIRIYVRRVSIRRAIQKLIHEVIQRSESVHAVKTQWLFGPKITPFYMNVLSCLFQLILFYT